MRPNPNSCPRLGELPSPASGNRGWPWTEESTHLGNTMPDGSAWSRISIVTPSYNQGQFIEATIRSVLLQGYPNIEFIIMDGGSTDNSLAILKKYEPWLAYWVSEPDRGQSHAINKGIQRATGDILFWLNSDDICLPDAFRTIAMAFHSNPAVGLVSGQARLIDAKGQVIGELCSYFKSWEEVATNPGNSIRQVSTFFSRRLFDEVGLVDENPRLAMDNELLFRFTRRYSPVILNEYVSAFRTHPAANTGRELLRWYEETDRTRTRALSSKSLIAQYRARSSANWLNLSESNKWVKKQRLKCLVNAVHNKPSVMMTRSFWSAVKLLVLSKN